MESYERRYIGALLGSEAASCSVCKVTAGQGHCRTLDRRRPGFVYLVRTMETLPLSLFLLLFVAEARAANTTTASEYSDAMHLTFCSYNTSDCSDLKVLIFVRAPVHLSVSIYIYTKFDLHDTVNTRT